MDFKLIKVNNFFFSYQKIPFKWFDINISSYKLKENNNAYHLDKMKITIQIIKVVLIYEYNYK